MPASSSSYLEVTWTDPATGSRGYLVIDALIRGVCSGGLRMRAGCTIDEVRGLAGAMARKEALHYRPGSKYVPLGGAKGGIDHDPYDPEAKGVLERYLVAMRALIERHWNFGEDMGVTQDTLDELVTGLGMRSTVQAAMPLVDDPEQSLARLAAATVTEVDGLGLDELVGGRGVATATLTALDRLGTARDGTRVVVQGFGSMGGPTARFLTRAGLRVVGLVDTDGVVANADGLDVERLLLTRDELGRIDRDQLGAGDEQLPRDRWLDVDTDVLVPAAVSYCIRPSDADLVKASLVVEAANLPVLPGAEQRLAERGVVVVPDFVANSATNAWWWWTVFGEVDAADATASFAKVDTEMSALVDELFDRTGQQGGTLREAAHAITESRLAEVQQRYG